MEHCLLVIKDYALPDQQLLLPKNCVPKKGKLIIIVGKSKLRNKLLLFKICNFKLKNVLKFTHVFLKATKRTEEAFVHLPAYTSFEILL